MKPDIFTVDVPFGKQKMEIVIKVFLKNISYQSREI